MCVQLGAIIGNNIYRADDKPKYHRGNSALIGINILAILLFIATKIYYIYRNKHRERVWNAMTEEVSVVSCWYNSQLTCHIGTTGLLAEHERHGKQEVGFPLCTLVFAVYLSDTVAMYTPAKRCTVTQIYGADMSPIRLIPNSTLGR